MAELGSSFTFSGHHSRKHFSSRDIEKQFEDQLKTAARKGRVYDVMQLFLRALQDHHNFDVSHYFDTVFSNFDRLNVGVQRNDIVALREAFAVACRRGRLNDVKRLSHVRRDNVAMLGTGLHFALLQPYDRRCKREHWKIIRWLMENTKLKYNPLVLRRALVEACKYNKLEEVRWMVQYRQLARDKETINEGIRNACENGHVAVMKCLLEHTNVDVYDTEVRNTLLHDVIRLNNGFFESEFHDACIMGDVTEMYRLVCKCGASVNEQDNYGNTPLHDACLWNPSRKRTDIIETLMMLGADVNITNDDKQTPAQVAIYRKHEELLPLLDRISLMDIYMRRQQLKLELRKCMFVYFTALLIQNYKKDLGI
jgi:hypothetical protein